MTWTICHQPRKVRCPPGDGSSDVLVASVGFLWHGSKVGCCGGLVSPKRCSIPIGVWQPLSSAPGDVSSSLTDAAVNAASSGRGGEKIEGEKKKKEESSAKKLL